MNKDLLWKELRSNQVHIEDNDIIIDELFQIIEARINTPSYIVVRTFTPFNYSKTDEFTSHHSNMGKYFYNRKGEIMRFMLDSKKCIHINVKHDRLRRALYYTN